MRSQCITIRTSRSHGVGRIALGINKLENIYRLLLLHKIVDYNFDARLKKSSLIRRSNDEAQQNKQR
jgi:hypothetical protein